MSAKKPLFVILLHGVGSNGADMAPLGDAWKIKLPTIECIAPDGIMTGPQGFGRAWFSIDGVTVQNRPDRIEASRAAFDKLLGDIIDTAGFRDHLDRVVLVGFSQGSMMALDATVSGRWPVAGVLAYSGRLATRLPFKGTPTRIRLIHGDADPVISVNEAHNANDILSENGFAVETTILPRVPHTISAEGVMLGGHFLADLERPFL